MGRGADRDRNRLRAGVVRLVIVAVLLTLGALNEAPLVAIPTAPAAPASSPLARRREQIAAPAAPVALLLMLVFGRELTPCTAIHAVAPMAEALGRQAPEMPNAFRPRPLVSPPRRAGVQTDIDPHPTIGPSGAGVSRLHADG